MRKLAPETLDPSLVIQAYAQGVFPMADRWGRIHWYAPDPRAILEHEHLHVSRSLRATIRKGIYEIRLDTAFEKVMRCCATRGESTMSQENDCGTEHEETWINKEFIKTYTFLHYAGAAHSVEAWCDGELVGGLYGVSIGGAFMGESMFSRATDASKVCLVALVEHLKRRGYVLHDTQFLTSHLATLGATEIPRCVYEKRLRGALRMRCAWSEQDCIR